MSGDFQIVYVLTNPAMPGLTKIGMTSNSDIENRLRQLYTTGVPVPFECEYACKVKDALQVERTLHFAFGDIRVNPNREFFRINPDRVISILKLLSIEEVTTEVSNEIVSEITSVDRQSGDRLKASRRPNMNFKELGIPVGSVLNFRDGPSEVKVISDRKVTLNGEEMYLTPATLKVLGYEENRPLQPSPYWLFNGRTLDEIYEEYHTRNEAA